MNKTKGFRRLVTVLSAMLLALGFAGTIIDSNSIWIIWGVICSAGVWLVYELTLYVITGFTDSDNIEKICPAPDASPKRFNSFLLLNQIMIPKWVTKLILALAIILSVFYACTHMVAAGDTWVSLASGRYYSNHGVSTTDPFSFNSYEAGPTAEQVNNWPDWGQGLTKLFGINTVKYWHPTGWINHNWLVDVLFYQLTTIYAGADSVSFNSLVYLKFAIYLLTAFILFRAIRIMDIHPFIAMISTCAVLFISRTFLTIRAYDFANLLSAGLLLILTLTVYRNIRFIWLIVPLLILWANVYSSYVFALANIGVFLIANVIALIFPKTFGSIGIKGIKYGLSALITAILGMIIFNPYHLSNITYAFSKYFGHLSIGWLENNQWHPAFEKNNPVGDSFPFAVMLICALAIIMLWLVFSQIVVPIYIRILDRRRKHQAMEQMENAEDISLVSNENSNSHEQTEIMAGYPRPKLELSLIAVATLSIYLGIQHRTFIPLSAIFACPIIALLLIQLAHSLSIANNFKRKNILEISPAPHSLKVIFLFAALFTTIGLGGYCGWKFKQAYFNPWHKQDRLNSLFMRMTASYEKPFGVCQFIRDNKLKGKIANSWTEGGFIAYNQDPDPKTGHIPLKLFIDGRATEAYSSESFNRWKYIIAGGEIIKNAQIKKETVTYNDIGKWIDNAFAKNNIWAVVVSNSGSSGLMPRGLETMPNWLYAYIDNQQKLLEVIPKPSLGG